MNPCNPGSGLFYKKGTELFEEELISSPVTGKLGVGLEYPVVAREQSCCKNHWVQCQKGKGETYGGLLLPKLYQFKQKKSAAVASSTGQLTEMEKVNIKC